MEDKKKIVIDVDVNGSNQIDQSIAAFDGLRKSINSLSQPLSNFSKSINSLDNNLSKHVEALVQINAQHDKMVSTGDKVTNKVEGVTTSFTTLASVFKIVGIEIKGLQIAMTGGLSIVLAFLPEIVNVISSFFKGKDAVAQMTDKMKGFNEIMKAAGSDAATQTAKLNLLYKSATDVKKSDEARAESIRLLKKEFPGYFEHLSNEDFKNGKANAAYLKLTRTIIDNAKAKAALNKITEESTKILDAKTQIHQVALFGNARISAF